MNKITLLGDPESKYWSQIEEIFNYIKNKKQNKEDIEVNLVEVEIKKFRNGEKKIKISKSVRKQICFFLHDSSKNPEAWFFELIATLQALKNADASEIIAVLPCLLYSRQDRRDEPRVSINAKVVADCISQYANHVITIDLHSEQIEGFYNIPLDNLYSFPVITDYLKTNYSEFLKNIVLVAPDQGSAKFVDKFKKRFEKQDIKVDLVIGVKHRPKEGEVDKLILTNLTDGNIQGKNALILDDIIDSGNTIVKCAEKLKEKGIKAIWVYATHGFFTEGFDKFKDIEKILTGNTLIQSSDRLDCDKLEIISLNNLLGEAIYRTATGKSLSELLE